VADFPVSNLLDWYKKNKREMPWRNTSDPYRIWISEIMLQQTRVDTVIPYYERFISAFPTVQVLSEAGRQQVLKLWEGLGYYSRARNMHAAAKTVASELDGQFPDSYDELLKLKGIGPYTAAAISSIAYGEKRAVVDGNVLRVLSRVYGIKDDIRLGSVKNEIQKLADAAIPEDHPGDFNQAVMELGATICSPKNPSCDRCPLSTECYAYNSVQTDIIPYKSSSKKIPHHQIGVGMITDEHGNLLIALRPDHVMLGGLWEFPGGKQKSDESIKETVARELKEELSVEVVVKEKFMELKHAYSHFKITLHAFWCTIEKGVPRPNTSNDLKWVSLSEIQQYPFPKANKLLIEKLQKTGQAIPESPPRI
jgi:A/G-specific adenine glycosylase